MIFSKGIARNTAVCRNPHKWSKWNSRYPRHFAHKRTFYQNVVSTKNYLSLYFRKNVL